MLARRRGSRRNLEKCRREASQIRSVHIKKAFGGARANRDLLHYARLAAAALQTDSGMRWPKLPQKFLDAVTLDSTETLIELDYRTELVLRKAYVLADDWRIESPELVRQFDAD